MNKNTDLFLLIETLSKSEKRYFKLFATKGGARRAKHSILLFDAIEKQIAKSNKKTKKYDEVAVFKKVSGALAAKQYSVTKMYLHNMILKSLHLFHADVVEDVKERLHYMKILFDRNLHHQCYEVIAKAKKIARKYELNDLLLQIYEWEKTIIQSVESKSSSLVKMTEKIIKEEEIIVDRIRRIREYKNFCFRFVSLPYKSDALRDSMSKKMFEKLNHRAISSNRKENQNFNEKYSRYKAFEFFYSKNEDHLSSYRFTKMIIHLLESNPDQIRLSPFKYIGSLNNHILNCRRLRKYKEAHLGINGMRTMSATLNQSYSFLHTFVFQSTYLFELKIYLDTGQFDKAVNLVKVINGLLKKYEKKISELYTMLFFYNFSLAYFGFGDYKTALYWNNLELNHPSISLFENQRRTATILNLIIHYELQNFELLTSITRSLYRGYGVKHVFNNFEVRLIDFFHSLINMNFSTRDRKNSITMFSNTKKDLLDIKKKNPLVVNNPPDFDFILWLDSKIEGIPFAKVVGRRSK